MTSHFPPPGGYYRQPAPVPTNIRQRSPDTYNADPYPMPDRTLTVQRIGLMDEITPRIRLVGQWLLAAGFKPGTRVTVTVDHYRLVIVPAPEEGA